MSTSLFVGLQCLQEADEKLLHLTTSKAAELVSCLLASLHSQV